MTNEMTSPTKSSFRPLWLSQNEDAVPYHSHVGHGPFSSLLRTRSYQGMPNKTGFSTFEAAQEDEEAGPHRRRAMRDDDELGCLLKDGRRMSRILQGPQARSINLIGKSNPRYRWERYWQGSAELSAMSKPLRKYYERTNELVEQYLYIDCLLDSNIPYEIMDEYAAELGASAFTVPDTISEESSVTPELAEGENAAEASSAKTVPKTRTPKDIFRASQEMPLLWQNGSHTTYGSTQARRGSDASRHSGPIPNLPWLEDAELESDDPIVTWAIWVNMIANIILLAGKIVVLVSVPSLSVLASLVDAVLDFLSTAIVWVTTNLISSSQKDQYHYPVGRKRLEPVGVLVFSIVMITSFAQVSLQCIQRLLGPDREILELGVPAIGIMVGTIVVKGAVWIWCRLIKNSSVRALAADAVTDVIFNTGSILFPIIGFYARIWWLDALGGLLLSIVVIFNWSQTSAHHVRNLTGFSAQPDERNLLLYLTMRFATSIRKIQNLRAYHAGDKLFVEVDIVLSANTPLKDSHDLSEVLTYFLEAVPIVDRAFVHVDYVSYNAPTHMLK